MGKSLRDFLSKTNMGYFLTIGIYLQSWPQVKTDKFYDESLSNNQFKYFLTQWLKSLYIPRDSFSPESEGRVKPRTAIEAIRTHGIIRLKK